MLFHSTRTRNLEFKNRGSKEMRKINHFATCRSTTYENYFVESVPIRSPPKVYWKSSSNLDDIKT